VELGINLGFAFKRWPEPERWAALVREELGLEMVQFTLDLLDPWWPEAERRALAARVRRVADANGLTIHSAQLGLAWYTYNGLLHPEPEGRAIAREWWRRAIATGAELGVPAVGGPLGAFSVAESRDAETVTRRSAELVEDVVAISEEAAAAGLGAILIEPTPLPRELPHTIPQAQRLAEDLRGQTAVPVQWVIDVGHALYRPLYGADVTLEDWLVPLRDDIGLLHLQNHDYQSDTHLGWPDARGQFDVAAFAGTVRDGGLGDVPVAIELFFPFEMDDEAVLATVRSTVDHCREVLTAGSHPPVGSRQS
jgi:sugar phosphate isomerase/epimerase